jgi:O-antigen ligase
MEPLVFFDIRKMAINIENTAIKHRFELAFTNKTIIKCTAISVFLPYQLTTVILAFLSIFILTNKDTRQWVFIHRGTRMLKLFFILVLTVSFFYHNWLGFLVGVGMILALTLGLYLRSIMTRDLFEQVLIMICTLSLTSTGYAILEAAMNVLREGVNKHRIAAGFYHPNYFGTIAATVIIICAYKILSNKENNLFYYFVAVMNVISLYLCESMFAFIEVFIGVTILLVLFKRYRLLAAWAALAAIGAFLIFNLNIDLIPRLNDVSVTFKMRREIWRLTIEQIKRDPLFGHGFMSFRYLYDANSPYKQFVHSHSIYLDSLLNFGVVGAALFLWYFIRYYISVIKAYNKKGNGTTAALIFALTAAALVHGVTDLTLFWIQTLPLFLIILAGQGPEEKEEQFVLGMEFMKINYLKAKRAA